MARVISTQALFLFVLAAASDVHGLRCYTCLHNQLQKNDACVNNATLVDVTTCSANQKYCKVEEIVIPNASGNFGKFQRMCSSKCSPLCSKAEGHKRCVTCCQLDLCNGCGSVMERLLRLTVPLILASNVVTLFLG
ncbi:hypothetical protein CAPTEDRAFT_195084 [Capitella teleta]|uniref:Snake toxin/toxin-like domain-containing protein n=1 Tax=Capitella teleta TaxID=283909 RepID=R7TQB6_CAPTE|nr:hypothetical protein CAPTEDRAFT_195084 [Capitella teleta]|eukprot:ELT96108.1 hypothetical protein CAPTEDRAFT_195084 [Capitella teleta]